MINKGMKRFHSAVLAVLLVLGLINLSPLGDLVASAASPVSGNYNQFQLQLQADPATNAVPTASPDGFGKAGAAGRIWTDKSVTADATGFNVTLSALAQEYKTTSTTDTSVGSTGNTNANVPAADVTFILDMSTSMGSAAGAAGSSGYDIAKPDSGYYYRVEAMAKAANEAINIVMKANPKNRIAVHWFGGGATSTHVGTLIELNSYKLSSGSEYLKYTRGGNSGSYTFTVAAGSNLLTANDNQPYTGGSKSLAAGTPTQNGIRYGISKTLSTLGTAPKPSAEPQRKPYVFVLSDGAATIGQTTWNTLPASPSSPTSPGSYSTNGFNNLSESNINTGNADIAAVTILTGKYMKNLMQAAYTTYNGTSTEPEFYTVGLGPESAINGTANGDDYATNATAVYAWAGLDPKTVAAHQTDSGFRKNTAVNTYGKLDFYTKNLPGFTDYLTAFTYSNFYTFAGNYSALIGSFNNLASAVESTTTILPLLDIPKDGNLGGSSETADMASAIVFTDEIGNGLTIDPTTLKIGDAVATVDTSATTNSPISTTYKFAGYGSKAVIKTPVGGVASVNWYIDADDMQPHIYRFANRTAPVDGDYKAPTDGAFKLNYKVKPAFTSLPDDNPLTKTYYLNSPDEAKTVAYFTPPANSPYYTADWSTARENPKTGGIGVGATYVSEESLNAGKATTKLGNSGRLDLQMGIVKSGPATVQVNGTIEYKVTIYNYTNTAQTNLTVTSEGTTSPQTNVTVPANGNTVLTFTIPAGSTPKTVTSGTATVSNGPTSNTVTTVVTDLQTYTINTHLIGNGSGSTTG
ncbi:MAG: hypothetical protein J7639_25435, partial [Paenibacillaceae bacterium]|nr:hypothetical protein [Paenibacillaceae bacterium]